MISSVLHLNIHSSLLTKMTFPLLCISCCLLLISCVKSEVFTVGDANLWSDGAAYDLWSQKYTFHVGDVLEFKYTIGEHNVYEVTKETYQSCDASKGGVLGKYESGDDKIKVEEARPYWFLCNVEGHCLGGMRFGIKIANASQSQLPNNNDKNATHPPSSPTSNAIRGRISLLGPGILLLIIKLLLRV